MTRMFIVHEVEDGDKWDSAWQPGPGSRHETFARIAIGTAQTFRDGQNPSLRGLVVDVSDMGQF